MSDTVLVVTHPACRAHDPGPGHPEAPARLDAVLESVDELEGQGIVERVRAPAVSRKALLRIHTPAYLDWLDRQVPSSGTAWLDADTALSPESGEAIARQAGAVVHAVERVLAGDFRRAFCAVRPPGHHAEPGAAMGFCFYNGIAAGAAAALAAGLERVAIVDFDVHHGNGTEACFAGEARLLLCSLFQHPLYPGSGLEPPANGVFVPLPEGTGGTAYRAAFAERVEPALAAFRPELVLVSAGFDAYAGDPLAGLALHADDYAWLTRRIVAAAEATAGGRVVSVLEGGYRMEGLRGGSRAHIQALAGPGQVAANSSG